MDGNIDGFFSAGSVTHTGGSSLCVRVPAFARSWCLTLPRIACVRRTLDPDPQPWWYVDLGQSQVVGSIRVWNRQDEIDTDEMQVVTTTAAGPLRGSFRLSYEADGVVEYTDDIAVDAVAQVQQEDQSSSVAGVGAGESMQAKLQALSKLVQVSVSRSSADKYGGYSWSITFLSEPGNLEQLRVHWNNITSPFGEVSVRTPIQGSSSVWYVGCTRVLLALRRLTRHVWGPACCPGSAKTVKPSPCLAA